MNISRLERPRRLVWALAPYTLIRVAGQGLEFGAFVLMARRLGPAGFGGFSVAFLAARYLGLIGDWGASIRGARDVAAARPVAVILALARRREFVTIAVCVVFVAACVAVGRVEFAPLAGTIAARGIQRDWVALGRGMPVRSSLPQAVQGSLALASVVLVSTPGGAALGVGAAHLAALAVSLRLNRLPRRTPGQAPRIDGWLLCATLADQVTISADTLLIAALRTEQEAGIYAALYRIPSAITTVVGLLVLAAVPKMTSALSTEAYLLARMRRRGIVLGGGAAAAIAIASVPLVKSSALLFGEAYKGGETALMILLLATAVATLAAPLHPLVLALERDRLQAAFTGASALLNIAGNLLVVPTYGMTGAAVMTLATQLGLLLAHWTVARAPASEHR